MIPRSPCFPVFIFPVLVCGLCINGVCPVAHLWLASPSKALRPCFAMRGTRSRSCLLVAVLAPVAALWHLWAPEAVMLTTVLGDFGLEANYPHFPSSWSLHFRERPVSSGKQKLWIPVFWAIRSGGEGNHYLKRQS